MGACSSTMERDASYLIDNNYHATKELAEYCLARNIRFLYASSCATYGDGSRTYINYGDSAAQADGQTIPAMDYVVIGAGGTP